MSNIRDVLPSRGLLRQLNFFKMNKRNFGVQAAVIVPAVCFGFVPMFMQYLKSMGGTT